VALPLDDSRWPTVDIYIPTYSEPLEIVSSTMMGALNIDYPSDKFRVYVCDDGFPRSKSASGAMGLELGKRAEALRALCERHGAIYLTRDNNRHAKSGNLNAAMAKTNGELMLVLDADHVPTRDILRNTVGMFMRDDKLAFVQTPHFFMNADPVEKNLDLANKMPAESDMFYRVVQKGLDLWNTSFFCGSAAVIRRTAIKQIGGFSTLSITEDASTSVALHAKGWRSAYLAKPMISGLQPETFSAFIVQRLRWGMGMIQIFMLQNPLAIKGLSMAQRLSYLSVVSFWLFPFARVAFFLSPILSILLYIRVYPSSMELFVSYTVPYIITVLLTFQKMFGRVRRVLMSELYETIQSFFTLPAILSTVASPTKPTFKVTPKGDKTDVEYISDLLLDSDRIHFRYLPNRDRPAQRGIGDAVHGVDHLQPDVAERCTGRTG
jgi:cellulose synthase (UDP-forming)